VFVYMKMSELNRLYEISFREYELILRLNRVKMKYFDRSSLRKNTSPEQITGLSEELSRIRDDLDKLRKLDDRLDIRSDLIFSSFDEKEIYDFVRYTENSLQNMYRLNMKEFSFTRRSVVINISLFLAFGLFLTVYFSFNISRPIEKLRKIVYLSKKNIRSPDLSSIKTGDEIEDLAMEFSSLFEEVNNARIEKERINIGLEKKLQEKISEMEEISRRVYHEKKLSSLGKMVAAIAHEVKNPLNVMLNLLPEAEEGDREAFKDIRKQIERINRLVSGFLDYARYEKYDFEPVDIREVLSSVIGFMEKSERNICFKKNISGSELIIPADEEKLEQAFLNILVNAKEALRENEHAEIEVSIQEDDDEIIIDIRDNGVGIPEEIRDRVFEPFFTTRNTGTGLGLAAVYNIIRYHKGDIKLSSETGVFTEFSVRLKKDPDKIGGEDI
ncbi:MAG: two-component system sensor histidine kinase NtrB, partial [Candidatus Muiribacteriaceae bacterium]